MIQRIQSVYLFIGVLAICAMLAFPYVRIVDGAASAFMYLHTATGDTNIVNAYDPLLIMVAGAVTALSFLIAIFLYKNRIRQMRFNAIVFIMNCLFIAVIFFTSDRMAKDLDGVADYKQVGVVMPLISMIMLVFANKAIKKDEMKVRAADRLR
jgi:hypothetical protein